MNPETHCVCGCGRPVPLHLETANRLAISLVPELVAWDRFRVELRRDPGCAPGSPVTVEALDRFLGEGGERYREAVAVVHGERAFTALGTGPARWLRDSARARRKLARVSPGAIDGSRAPRLSDEDRRLLDRTAPERTHSGGVVTG